MNFGYRVDCNMNCEKINFLILNNVDNLDVFWTWYVSEYF